MPQQRLKMSFLSQNSLFVLEQNWYAGVLVVILFLLIFLFYQQPAVAMWLGFAMAGYSVIANDSIQTLGTFLAANERQSWFKIWLFTGVILAGTMLYSWFYYQGDMSYGRLHDIPQPHQFTFLELLTPLLLIIMTWFRMPVSTTFLLLSVFSSEKTIQDMLIKTASGYVLALISGFLIYTLLAQLLPYLLKHQASTRRYWRKHQYLSTAWLWITWLMHDIANVTVFLPRSLTAVEALMVTGFLLLMLAIIVYQKGGRIQRIVKEKSGIRDYRAATIIDFIYASLLLILKEWSHIPMSTTWVFLGLLAGREIALLQQGYSHTSAQQAGKMIARDFVLAGTGLMISLIFAMLS